MTAPAEDPLASARREREVLFHRISWWEAHRYGALVPMAVGWFGVGYGVGYVVHLIAGTAVQVGYYVGVAALFLGGRAVDRMFAPTRLAVLDARIARLERQRR